MKQNGRIAWKWYKRMQKFVKLQTYELCPFPIYILDLIKKFTYKKVVTEEGKVKRGVEERLPMSWQLLKLDDEYHSIFCVL